VKSIDDGTRWNADGGYKNRGTTGDDEIDNIVQLFVVARR
jgi:hypothetical protein